MTRNDICARYFGSDQTQCSTHSAPFDSPSESRCSAARLSHDRGADAGTRLAYDETWDAFRAYEDKAAKQGSGMTREQLTGAAMMLGWLVDHSLSVPAPTLPALDALDVEVRPNEDGTVDEVIINVGGRCVFHLEQMDDDAYWFAIYTNPDPMADSWAFWMNRKGKRLLLKETERPAEALRDAV